MSKIFNPRWRALIGAGALCLLPPSVVWAAVTAEVIGDIPKFIQ